MLPIFSSKDRFILGQNLFADPSFPFLQSTKFVSDGSRDGNGMTTPSQHSRYMDQDLGWRKGSLSSPAIGSRSGGGPIFYNPEVHAYSPTSPKTSVHSSNQPILALWNEQTEDENEREVVDKLRAELMAKDQALKGAIVELQQLKQAQECRERVVRLEAETRSIQVSQSSHLHLPPDVTYIKFRCLRYRRSSQLMLSSDHARVSHFPL